MLVEQIEKQLTKAAGKCKTLQFSMRIPALNLDYSFSSTVPNQRFHSASVGKLMTTILIFKAIEEGKILLTTAVVNILEKGLLDGLFAVDGHDFQDAVTVQQLLGHTSGINDYFESKTFDGSLFTDEVIKNPDVFWTPTKLLDFTRSRQKAIAKPGEKFLYSDSGFVLLGLIVEAVFEMPFHRALETYIFKPCSMDETSLCFYSDGFNQEALAPLYINAVDVHLFKSLSCDFSGGGLSTTADDLVKFMDNLQNLRLINQTSLDQMATFKQRYHQGLYYGLGMMQVRFEEFFFLLKTLPRVQGHLGVTGVHAWFDPASKNTFALNVGDTKDMSRSFRLLISVLQLLQREQKKRA